MGEKKTSPYVKADLTSELDFAVRTVTSKLGITKANLTQSAIEYYLKHLFPESLPKSDLELFKQVKEDHLLGRLTRNYHDVMMKIKSIPEFEKEIKEFQNDIEKSKNKIRDLQLKLSKVKNQEIKKSLKTDIKDLEVYIEMNKSYIKNNQNSIDDAKSKHL